MNIEESIIDAIENCQVNDGLRFWYEPTKSIIKLILSGKSESFKYTHDLNDFVTKVETVRSGITVNAAQNYVYDNRNQLVSATRPMGTDTETFAYGSIGNRLQRDGESTDSTFDDVNRLTNDKKFTYEYDDNGNMIKKASIATGEVTEFDWDYRDRLVGVVIKPGESANPTSTISYKYDAFNRRIERNVNGTIARYVYDRGNIHLEYDGNNNFQAKYVHSDNVDEPLRMERPDNPYRDDKFLVQEFYYHRDRLGNITEITDFEGTVVQRYVYDAFGKVSIFDKDGKAITPNSANYLKSPYAFTGREYDHETGMYFYRARYYNPDVGRFISEDPIGFGGQDANLYRYVGNNSVNYADPHGLRYRVCTRPVKKSLGQVSHPYIDFDEGTDYSFGSALELYFGVYDVPSQNIQENPREAGNQCTEFTKDSRYDELVRQRARRNLRKNYHLTNYNCRDYVGEVLEGLPHGERDFSEFVTPGR